MKTSIKLNKKFLKKGKGKKYDSFGNLLDYECIATAFNVGEHCEKG